MYISAAWKFLNELYKTSPLSCTIQTISTILHLGVYTKLNRDTIAKIMFLFGSMLFQSWNSCRSNTS